MQCVQLYIWIPSPISTNHHRWGVWTIADSSPTNTCSLGRSRCRFSHQCPKKHGWKIQHVLRIFIYIYMLLVGMLYSTHSMIDELYIYMSIYCLYIFVWVSGQVFGWKENRESLGDTGRWLMFCETGNGCVKAQIWATPPYSQMDWNVLHLFTKLPSGKLT